ncbi:uncharacterized protein LOC127011709 [Drosophila biarmipes]|uniref:uncharacterized protein LOC127011709 n=1 Tax=Drosophila biarmipes TaxID=125945 RepID=UPI0021CC62E4|nr:uncharacterized protein LOC127011709 [Drosophila biarmipes]
MTNFHRRNESADTTRGSGFIGVRMELSNSSRNRDKVRWTRGDNTGQEPTQWVARGEPISSSRTTGNRVRRHGEVPGGRASQFQNHDRNVEHGRASNNDEGRQTNKTAILPQNPKVQGEINAKVDELLQMECIEHSTSPYSSPIVMVKKKTGKWRLCVDLRQINTKSIKDAYPMLRINYILDQLREARYINSLDLKDGYWQIPLKESSRQ